VPTFEKLDRILESVEWEQKFPSVYMRALTRSGSDHTNRLSDAGHQAHLGNKTRFSFELSWLNHDGFEAMVESEWAAITNSDKPIQRWQN
jgi:hypothetical protein